MQRSFLIGSLLFAALASTSPAFAQQLDAQTFAPAIGPQAAFATEGSGTVGHRMPTAGLLLNYSSRPIVILNEENDGSPDQPVEIPVVDQQLALHAMAGIGISSYFQLTLDLPIYIVNEGDLPDSFNEAGIGDLRLRAKQRFFGGEEDGAGFGAAIDLSLPTGNPELYIGTPGVTVAPRLVADYRTGPMWFALNVGALFRESQEFGANAVLGNAATFGVAAELEVMRGILLVTADLFGRSSFEDFASSEDTPVDLLLGGKLLTTNGFAITGAAGGGVVPGLGAPEFRMLFGLSYAPRKSDFDGDGVLNRDDRCPEVAEDLDGYEDADGCPELDNDGDSIADSKDTCPLAPEDMDGFQDEDGCPDPDNDGDGILDAVDECRDEPEDFDGFQDEDGCPDLDNDDDGILDAADQCPLEPEDLDGFQDEDGCPDPDNDNDGILDAQDACPNEPGTIEDKGCPAAEQKAVLEQQAIRILDKVFFETDSAMILPESYPLLNQVALILKTNPQVRKVEIGGHTDSRGRDAANLALSQQRAESVRAYLMGRGVDPERLTAVGYGEAKPVAEGRNEAAYSQNRRVEFNIIEQGAPEAEATEGEETPSSEPDAAEAEPADADLSAEPTEASPEGADAPTDEATP